MRGRGASGATLVEVLVAVSILGIISAALSGSLFLGLKTTQTTTERLAESSGAQILSTVFPADVQSATAISVSSAACGLGVPAVTFDQVDPDPAGPGSDTALTIAYVVGDPVGNERQLVRRVCQTGTVTGERVVARGLALADPLTVVCTPDPACPAWAQTVTAVVQGVGGYSYQVTGSRRAS